ncbi:MAG: TRC40/GET3/ArsA family transport-energizing ATPase [Alphaproteobacteria bacterium]|nr:TRC40/GET3/ArsA family transport-energizing ATPase [Alphaproteobacteria bacterium]
MSDTAPNTRIILVSGKGGVGKTTAAAATAIDLAARGRRTLVMSFDVAHSLRDSLGLGGFLQGAAHGAVSPVTDNLDMLEIDVSKEIEAEWGPIYRHFSMLMSHGGLTDVLSSELAMLPGMEDVSALLAVDRHARSGEYDALVLDCPPTASTLRFIGMASGLKWYANHRLARERRMVRMMRPLASLFHGEAYYLPADEFFAAYEGITARLDAVEAMLRNPEVTSLRLVCTPEKVVARETQRAFMYFCMYGVLVDQILVNRVFPEEDPYFRQFALSQQAMIADMRDWFAGVPLTAVPMLEEEVVGPEPLARFGARLSEGRDPGAFYRQDSPITVTEEADGWRFAIKMPFVGKSDIQMSRQGEELMLRVGTFKRHISIPSAMMKATRTQAAMEGDTLVVRLSEG